MRRKDSTSGGREKKREKREEDVNRGSKLILLELINAVYSYGQEEKDHFYSTQGKKRKLFEMRKDSRPQVK